MKHVLLFLIAAAAVGACTFAAAAGKPLTIHGCTMGPEVRCLANVDAGGV